MTAASGALGAGPHRLSTRRNNRVLLVIAQLDIGGAETQVVRLARRLGSLGFEPEVAVYYAEGELEPVLVRAGIRVHHLTRSSKIGFEAILDLRRILREGGHGIVHSFLWPANWRSRIAGLLAGTPVIISSTRSVETWLQFHHVLVDRLLAHWTDAIVVNASAIRDYLLEKERVSRSLFHLIYNGLEEDLSSRLPGKAEARKKLGLDANRRMVLIVGNFQPEKNHEDFLRMAAIVGRRLPETRFWMVGDGARRESLEGLACELDLNDSLEWLGRQDDVLPFLSACDVFLNVSLREGCCNSILEAMAAGKPVVAYTVGGNPELVEHGCTGRLFAQGDVEGLADAVVDYLEHPDLARRDGEAGARRISRRFLARTTAQQTAELYTHLLEGKGVR